MSIRNKAGFGLCAAVLTAGCQAANHAPALPTPEPINPRVVGYTSTEGRAIAENQFILGRAALMAKGFTQVRDTNLVIVPLHEHYECDQSATPNDDLNARYFYDCNSVVVSQRFINDIDQVVPSKRPGRIDRKMYPKLLRIVIGHELGHAVLPRVQEPPADQAEADADVSVELHADCIGGQLLLETKPKADNWLLTHDIYNWVDIEGDAATHGSAIERSYSVFSGMSGNVNCTARYGESP